MPVIDLGARNTEKKSDLVPALLKLLVWERRLRMKYAGKLILAKNDEYRVGKEQGRGGSTLKLGGVGTGRIPLTRYRRWGRGRDCR